MCFCWKNICNSCRPLLPRDRSYLINIDCNIVLIRNCGHVPIEVKELRTFSAIFFSFFTISYFSIKVHMHFSSGKYLHAIRTFIRCLYSFGLIVRLIWMAGQINIRWSNWYHDLVEVTGLVEALTYLYLKLDWFQFNWRRCWLSKHFFMAQIHSRELKSSIKDPFMYFTCSHFVCPI